MKKNIIFACIWLILTGCSDALSNSSIAPNEYFNNNVELTANSDEFNEGMWFSWGYYQLEISRDGLYSKVTPKRKVTGDPPIPFIGYHLNVVKFLEAGPCTDCIKLSNIHKLANGDVSVDISIKHPFDNPVYTGFDVRGIIMFPASLHWPDKELSKLCGLSEKDWRYRSSCETKGDAILVNAEGWTSIWAADFDKYYKFNIKKGYPITQYYPGTFANYYPEKIVTDKYGNFYATLNPFRRFYSNENRHMFEVGKTVKRTYIIRPPASGPILAAYAVYAHWDEPTKIPVTDPSVDFPPEANSVLPYEFYVYQVQEIDPDAPLEIQQEQIIFCLKTWQGKTDHINAKYINQILPGSYIPSVKPIKDMPGFYYLPIPYKYYYKYLPTDYISKMPFIFQLDIENPNDYPYLVPQEAADWYIFNVQFSHPDGEW